MEFPRTIPAGLSAVLLVLAGCSSGGNGGTDAFDAGEEDALDAGEPDVTGDASVDASSDAGGDAGDAVPWPWCPEASTYHGGPWDWTIRATESAVYCVYCKPSADSAALPDELRRKSELRIVPGDYPIPSAPGQYNFRLPLCLRFTEPDAQPLLADVGTLTVSQSTRNGVPYLNFSIEQPLQTQSGDPWLFQASLIKPASDGNTEIPLDGSFPDPAAGLAVGFRICKLPCDFADDTRELASCAFTGVPPERHRLIFTGGQVDLLLRISPGYTMAGQLPALFERAEGNLDNQPFRQTDYWKLAFTGGIQHYLNRHFLFYFDQPLGAACGLKAENLDVFLSDPPARLTTIRCDLTEIEERAVTGELWEELP